MDIDFHQASFEATVDEVADVAQRFSGAMPSIQRQHRQVERLTLALAIGVSAVVFFSGRWPRSLAEWGVWLGVSAAFLWLVSVPYRRFAAASARRAYQRVALDYLNGAATVPCEFEVTADGLRCAMPQGTSVLPWTRLTNLDDSGADVDLWFNPGLAVVRSRGFTSGAHHSSHARTGDDSCGSRTCSQPRRP